MVADDPARRARRAGLIKSRPLDRWRETLAALTAYCGAEEWPGLCDALARRLAAAGLPHAATLVWVCAGNLDRAVRQWSADARAGGLTTPALRALVERALVLGLGARQAQAAPALADLVAQYAGLLASQARRPGRARPAPAARRPRPRAGAAPAAAPGPRGCRSRAASAAPATGGRAEPYRNPPARRPGAPGGCAGVPGPGAWRGHERDGGAARPHLPLRRARPAAGRRPAAVPVHRGGGSGRRRRVRRRRRRARVRRRRRARVRAAAGAGAGCAPGPRRARPYGCARGLWAGRPLRLPLGEARLRGQARWQHRSS